MDNDVASAILRSAEVDYRRYFRSVEATDPQSLDEARELYVAAFWKLNPERVPLRDLVRAYAEDQDDTMKAYLYAYQSRYFKDPIFLGIPTTPEMRVLEERFMTDVFLPWAISAGASVVERKYVYPSTR